MTLARQLISWTALVLIVGTLTVRPNGLFGKVVVTRV